MVFYDDINKQHFRSACCKETFFHYIDNEHFPSFQFFTDVPISFEGIQIQIYDLQDNLIGIFDDADFNAINTIYHGTAGYTYVHNLVDIISYPAGVDYETGYYLKICFCIDDAEFVFAACGTSGLYVYRVDNAGDFIYLDDDDQGGSAKDVWSDDHFVYLANGTRGIEVYSIDENGILTHLDNDFISGDANGVWSDGTFIYLASNTRGLDVYSVSDAGILTWLDNDNQGHAQGVWGDGKFIYVANDATGIDSYSVSDVGILTQLDDDDQGGNAKDVWGDGHFVYLANDTRGIEVYRVDNAGVFTHLDNDFIDANGYGVWGDGNYIYLANNTRGIEVYSVSIAGILTHVDNDFQGGAAYDIWGDRNFIYLANDGAGPPTFASYSVNDVGILTYIDNGNPLGFVGGAFAKVSVCDVPDSALWCWYSEAFKVCDCEVEGAGDGLNLIENGWFEDWSGAANPNNVPDGWTVHNNDATNYVADAGGECQMISDNTQNIYIRQIILTIGVWYVWEIEITARISGGVSIYCGGVLQTFTAAGSYTGVFQAIDTGLALVEDATPNCNITFTNVQVEEFVGFTFCDFLTLNWWSDCDWDSIIYQYGYRNSLVLDTELNNPSEDIVINPNERQGEMFVRDVIIKKRYRFKIRIPEYLWNALIRLPAYGSEMPNFHAWITLPDGSACPMSEVAILGEWDKGNCMNTFTIEFVDNDEYPVVATNCCKDEDVSEV